MYKDTNGILCAYESQKDVPFNIKRVFTVAAKYGEVRGNHAHKKCSQLLVCISGGIKVLTDNGYKQREFNLKDMGQGLIVPPGVWASQKYTKKNSLLMVLCDQAYEAEDYIRSYEEFKLFIKR